MSTTIPQESPRDAAKNIIDGSAKDSVVLKALVSVLLDAINDLRAKHSLSAYSMLQLKNAMKNKIDAGEAD